MSARCLGFVGYRAPRSGYLGAPLAPRASGARVVRVGTSGAKVRSAACPDTITKPLQPIVGTSVRLCAKSPELFPTSCSSALADRKSNLNRARAPTSSVRSSGPLREPWTDDGTKLEKRRLYRNEIFVEATMHAGLQHVIVVCPVRVDVGVLACCVGHSLTEHGLSLRRLV